MSFTIPSRILTPGINLDNQWSTTQTIIPYEYLHISEIIFLVYVRQLVQIQQIYVHFTSHYAHLGYLRNGREGGNSCSRQKKKSDSRRDPCTNVNTSFQWIKNENMLQYSFQIQVRGREIMQNDDQNCSEGTWLLSSGFGSTQVPLTRELKAWKGTAHRRGKPPTLDLQQTVRAQQTNPTHQNLKRLGENNTTYTEPATLNQG